MSLNQLFGSIFDDTMVNMDIFKFSICVVTSLLVGIFIAYLYMYKTKYTKSFVVTLVTLPSVISVVIMMVNGNVGAGVAVAGAFSLVRFRSVPGTAREIGVIFQAMGAGLAIGMGYLGHSILFVIFISIVNLILTKSSFGDADSCSRSMIITIPENLDYTGVFDDLFEKYTSECNLKSVKTTNMGSMFKISYDVILKDAKIEKHFIDDLRCRNGNLEIVLAKQSNYGAEL